MTKNFEMNLKFEEEVIVSEKRAIHIRNHKSELEKLGKVDIKINKDKNLITVVSTNVEKAWLAKQVIIAISRGFNFKIAEKLFNPEVGYVQLNLRDYGGKNKKQLTRLKSRVIGRNGSTKHKIQQKTGTNISISGRTISLIGEPMRIELARKTIEKLLSGAKHSSAYWFLKEQLK